MKQKLFFFLYIFFSISAFAQQSKIDSLKRLLSSSKEDTIKVNALNKLAFILQGNNPDEAMGYGKEALSLSEKLKYDKGKADAYNEIGLSFYNKGEYDSALKFHNKSLVIC